jgi:hypothetical protein
VRKSDEDLVTFSLVRVLQMISDLGNAMLDLYSLYDKPYTVSSFIYRITFASAFNGPNLGLLNAVAKMCV